MRWSEGAHQRSPRDTQWLINMLTLGCGRTALTARLIAADAAAADVVAMADAAHAALSAVAHTLLIGYPISTVSTRTAAMREVHAIPWSRRFDRLTAEDAVWLLDALEAATRSARCAAESVLRDDALITVQRHVATARTALVRASAVLSRTTPVRQR